MTSGPDESSPPPTIADRRERLRAKSHVDDDALVDALLAAGVTAKRFAAFEIVPCLAMAWIAGTPNGKQLTAIRELASARGVLPDSPAAQQLDSWLARAPGPALVDLWCRWVDLAIEAHAMRRLRRELLDCLPRIAKAGGHTLAGLRLSHTQAALSKRVKHAFDRLGSA